jgi:hypothetical protein
MRETGGGSLRVRLALALGVPAALVLGLEGGARLYLGDRFLSGLPAGHPNEACALHDADLGWVNKPGVRTRVVAPRFEYDVAINRRGLRDRDHPYEKPDGVLRVLLLGDSLAWGWGVDDGLAFADLAEEELGPGVEVVNLGVPGYSSDQELWLLEREGVRYEPDIVLLCFILNDIVGNASVRQDELVKPRYVRRAGAAGAAGDWVLENHPAPPPEPAGPTPLGARLWLASGLLQLLRPADSERARADAGRELAERRQVGGARAAQLRSEQQEIDALAAEVVDPDSATSMLLARIRAACEEMGAPLVAFSIAHHHDRYLYSPMFPMAPGALRDGETSLSRNLAVAGERIGFRTFSVDRAMLAETERGVGLSCGDGHLNERGNEVVAARIVEELRPLLDAQR